MLGRLLALLLLVGVVVVEPASADSVLATVPAPTAVRSWRRTAVLSLFDSRSNSYRLAVSRNLGAPEPVADVAPAARPFDADIGLAADGTAVIVYARCAGKTCHLYRTTPDGGGEIPIVGATSADGSETAPTVWGTRLAFARTYTNGSARVYVRPLDAPASVRSTRLPGVPRSFTDSEGHRRAINDGEVPELELRATSLAEIVHWERADGGICGEGQVRLVDVRTRRDALVGDTICGLGGQTWLGLSWIGSQLFFARTCPGDPGGCQDANALAYRYTPRTRRMEIAKRPAVLVGFAAGGYGARALEVRATNGPGGRCDNYVAEEPRPACDLVVDDPLAFRPVPIRRHPR